MDRVQHSTAVSVLPVSAYTGTIGFYSNDTPTWVTAGHLNQLQEELYGTIVFAGITPSNSTLTQLRQAIQTIAGTLASPTFTGTVTAPTCSGTTLNYTTGNIGTGNITTCSGTTLNYTTGNIGTVVSTGAITSSSASAGIGYANGSGGLVTQITSRTTGVTLNTICGSITLFSVIAAISSVSAFTLTNSAIAATDNVILTVLGGTSGAYTVGLSSVAVGSCVIYIRNVSGVATVAEAPVIRFSIIKSVNA